MHTQEDSGLCAHTGGFRALCTHRRIPSSVHTRAQALCTGKGSSSVYRQGLQALCTGKGSSSVHKRVQALCAQGFKLCAQKAPSSVHRQGFSSVHKRLQALCTGKGSSSVHRQGFSSVHTQEYSGLCAHTGGLLVKNRVFELSNCTSLISSGFYTFQTYSQ